MSKSNKKVIFYLSLFLIPVGMFSKMWITSLQKIFMGNEYFFIIFIGSFIIILSLDFDKLLNTIIQFKYFESKILLLLTGCILYGTFLHNTVEFQKISNFLVWLSYIILIIVYFFIIPKLLLENRNYLIKFFLIISNFGFIFTIIGLLMYFGGIFPIPDYSFGMISLINHPNNTSMVITITIFPTLYILINRWNNFSSIYKIFYFFSFFLQLIGQLLTFTRAGMIATSIGLLIFIIFYFRGKTLFLIPLIAFIVPVFGVAFFQAKGFASFISRFYLLLPAYSMIAKSKESFLWGYGLTNGLVEYKKKLVEFLPNEFLINDPHNTYVTLILMLGALFTLMLLFLAFIVIYKCIYRLIKTNNINLRYLYLFIVTSSMSIFVQGLFDAELIKADFYTIHYLLVLLGIAYYSFKIFPKASITKIENF